MRFPIYSRDNLVIICKKSEIMLYENPCNEKFYDPLMNFFEEEYTKRCILRRATTYQKFSLGSLTLISYLPIKLGFFC
jgi:hypothetical protein